MLLLLPIQAAASNNIDVAVVGDSFFRLPIHGAVSNEINGVAVQFLLLPIQAAASNTNQMQQLGVGFS